MKQTVSVKKCRWYSLVLSELLSHTLRTPFAYGR
jgi:hypothetical protein